MTLQTAEAQPVLVLGAEHEDFRRSLRGFLERHAPEAKVREALQSPTGHDLALWARMAEELGLQGLTVPERFGGAGYGPLDAVPVFEELGRALAPGPYFATVALAANALLQSGDEAAMAAHLPGIAAGDTTAALAWTGPSGRAGDVAVEAADACGAHALHGRAAFVPAGATADLLVVAAQLDGRVALFAAFGDAPGLARTPLRSLDETRPLAALDFAGTPARLIGEPGDGTLARALDVAVAALAAEQVGGAQRLLELAVAYAKDRQQFGRPIGSYQAIKHRCADMLIALEGARALAYHAAWAAAEAPEELPAAASAAKVACSEAYAYVAEETIEVHGGIGFTWEHPAHLYFKRAHSSRVLLGTPADHRRRFADAAA
jgi:alkylation response protein AidB-like acyl-CoA dehydrogenase